MDISSTKNRNANTRVIGAVKPKKTPMTEFELWSEYEARKRAWVALNGYGNPQAYDAMIRQVTKELGI